MNASVSEKPVLYGVQINAEYIEQQVPDYRDNPMIEALPQLYEVEEVLNYLTHLPLQDDSQRHWGKQVRMHCVQQIKNFTQPLAYHVELEGSISRVIRHGYTSRNPLSPLFTRQFSVGFKTILDNGLLEGGKNIVGNRPSGSGFPVIGISGIGKTTAIEKILMLYPQVINHTKYKEQPFILKQLVWLKLECPASGSLKVLCQNFFRQIDLILETNYYKKFVNSRSTKESLLAPMAQIASLHGLGVLVVDEIQRLSLVKNKGEQETLNYFTELINTIGLPVILVGTFKSMFLFDSVFAEARRAEGQGDHIISHLKKDDEWDIFLSSLWELQWTKNVCPLTDELNEIMYDKSQGIIDIAVKLYMLCQWRAISTGSEKIDANLIRAVSKEKLKFVQPMLDMLRRGNMQELKKFDDLYYDWAYMNDCIKEEKQKIFIHGQAAGQHQRASNNAQISENTSKLISMAVDMGLNPDKAAKIVLEIINASNGMADISNLTIQVANKVLSQLSIDNQGQTEGKSVSKGKKKTKPLFEKNDLRQIAKDAQDKKIYIYDALKESGYIKDPVQELLI